MEVSRCAMAAWAVGDLVPVQVVELGWTELHRSLFRSQDISGAKLGERRLLRRPVKVVVGCDETATSVVDVRPKGQGVNHTVTPLVVSSRAEGLTLERLQ